MAGASRNASLVSVQDRSGIAIPGVIEVDFNDAHRENV